MFGVTLWEMFTYCEEPWFGLSGRQVSTCQNTDAMLFLYLCACRQGICHSCLECVSPPLCCLFFWHALWLSVLASLTFTLQLDIMAGRAGGRTPGEATWLPSGAIHCNAKVLGMQSCRQTQLCPAQRDGGGGLKLFLSFSFKKKSKKRLLFLPHEYAWKSAHFSARHINSFLSSSTG